MRCNENKKWKTVCDNMTIWPIVQVLVIWCCCSVFWWSLNPTTWHFLGTRTDRPSSMVYGRSISRALVPVEVCSLAWHKRVLGGLYLASLYSFSVLKTQGWKTPRKVESNRGRLQESAWEDIQQWMRWYSAMVKYWQKQTFNCQLITMAAWYGILLYLVRKLVCNHLK